MILSMTGYADAQLSDGEDHYALEIKAVNNRYFKASIKLPDPLSLFEPEVEKLLRKRLQRGSVMFSLRLRTRSADTAYEVNSAALTRYLDQLTKVGSGNNVTIDLGTIMGLPGVCQPPELDEEKRHHQWEIVSTLANSTIDKLIEMRRVEGKALRDDLLEQCTAIREHVSEIADKAPTVVHEYHQRLLQRVNDLLAASKLELQLDDLRREIAVYAERCDINEEVSRLRSHLDQFERTCDSKEPAGRKLDFLTQEMLRETNTIGSKSNDAGIAEHVVDIKGSIDRLKEQVQNIE